MQIEFRRSGGVAGITLQGDVDTEQMSPTEAEHMEGLVRRAYLASAPSSGHEHRAVDRFEYEITVKGREQHQHLLVGEGEVTPELRALFDQLLKIARRRGN